LEKLLSDRHCVVALRQRLHHLDGFLRSHLREVIVLAIGHAHPKSSLCLEILNSYLTPTQMESSDLFHFSYLNGLIPLFLDHPNCVRVSNLVQVFNLFFAALFLLPDDANIDAFFSDFPKYITRKFTDFLEFVNFPSFLREKMTNRVSDPTVIRLLRFTTRILTELSPESPLFLHLATPVLLDWSLDVGINSRSRPIRCSSLGFLAEIADRIAAPNSTILNRILHAIDKSVEGLVGLVINQDEFEFDSLNACRLLRMLLLPGYAPNPLLLKAFTRLADRFFAHCPAWLQTELWAVFRALEVIPQLFLAYICEAGILERIMKVACARDEIGDSHWMVCGRWR
jgi:hypothetical protein